MKRLGRLILWLMFWPVGLWRSIAHSHQKQLDKALRRTARAR